MPSLPPALVLAAGLGTRLQPLTAVRAKPAIPVGGVPLISRIVAWLVHEGVTDIVVNLHYLPESITRVLGDGSDLGARVRYSWEQPTVLGSAGGPRQALDILGSDTFLLLNADTMRDVPISALVADHERSGALVTLALIPNLEPQKYGGVKVATDGSVAGFVPRGDSALGSYHFVGLQIAHRRVFETLAPGEPAHSIGGCYDALIAQRPGSIRAFVTEAAFSDIGTVSDYWQTSWALSPDTTGAAAGAGARIEIGQGARLVHSIVWDDVRIGAGAVVEGCILTDGVEIAAGARYTGSILVKDGGGELRVVPLPEDCR